jgi:hypothetical protein
MKFNKFTVNAEAVIVRVISFEVQYITYRDVHHKDILRDLVWILI